LPWRGYAKLHKSFETAVETMVDCNTMKDAVRSAYYLAKDGDVVCYPRLVPVSTFLKIMKIAEDNSKNV